MKTLAILAVVLGLFNHAWADDMKPWYIVPIEPRGREPELFALEFPGLDEIDGAIVVRPWRIRVVLRASMRKSLSRAELSRAVEVLNRHNYMKYSGWRLGKYDGPVIGRYRRLADQEAVDAADRLTREDNAKRK